MYFLVVGIWKREYSELEQWLCMKQFTLLSHLSFDVGRRGNAHYILCIPLSQASNKKKLPYACEM